MLEDKMNFASSGRSGSYVSPSQKLVIIGVAVGMWIPVINIAVICVGIPLYIWLGLGTYRDQAKIRKERDAQAALARRR